MKKSDSGKSAVSGELQQTGTRAAGKELSLSVVKAISILKTVAEADSGRSLTELVAATGYPTTVCHRMLATLEHEHLVDRDKEIRRTATGSYC